MFEATARASSTSLPLSGKILLERNKYALSVKRRARGSQFSIHFKLNTSGVVKFIFSAARVGAGKGAGGFLPQIDRYMTPSGHSTRAAS